ncbi:MAG TPA: hypothetical protein VMR76_03020 [Candidatus Saccharimonadia bacterium]|nr:hypothetical protein [Candidatus Saccharimonadia bacterium]
MGKEEFDPIGSIYVKPNSLIDPPSEVAGFHAAVDRIGRTKPEVLNMDAIIANASERGEKSLTASCVEVIKERLATTSTANKLYVGSEEVQSSLRLNTLLISRTSIAETSAHQVFFGAIGKGNQTRRIAVKPFRKPVKGGDTSSTDEPIKVVKEWVNTTLARKRGLDTFKPLGFMIVDKVGFLLTDREDGIEPMDNANWESCLDFPEQNGPMIEDIMKIGAALARLHHMGVYHHDPQLKNCVITQSGSIHLIDWEGAEIFDPNKHSLSNYADEDKIRDLIVHDLESLFGSLAHSRSNYGVGLMDRLTFEAQWSYFDNLVLTPYIEERLALHTEARQPNIDKQNNDELLLHLALIEEMIKEFILAGELYKSSSMRHTEMVH